MINRKQINDYLYYGYLMPSEIPKSIFNITIQDHYTYTVPKAVFLFNKILDKAIDKCSANKYCVIPISGGWDSRILLGAAAERLETSQIKTFSFGNPGQLDYEIGRKVAGFLGIEHVAIDVRNIQMGWDLLAGAVKEAPWTKPFDAYINRYSIKKVANAGDIVLSGFMGDPLFGSHLTDYADIDECIRIFVKRQDITEKSVLIENGYNPINSIPNIAGISSFDLYDVLDFGVRQACMVAPIVTPLSRLQNWGMFLGNFEGSDAHIVAPFAHPEWVQYWAFAPKDMKKEKNLFFKMFQNKFPELYKIPSKDYFGATKKTGVNRNLRRNFIRVQNRLHKHFPSVFRQSNKMLNYMDFDEQFRENDDYQDILKNAVKLLKDDNITEWINFDEMWSDHLTYKADHAKSFRVLIGLALNLSVNNPIR